MTPSELSELVKAIPRARKKFTTQGRYSGKGDDKESEAEADLNVTI